MSGENDTLRPAINPWIIAIAVMMSTFMEVLDTTVVNVSLPHIAGSLSATADEATWTLTSYLVSNAIILPLTGWLANHFGRKRLLLTSVSGFTAASFLCGLAPTLPFLILMRILQGAFGGGLQPLSQAILLESFKPEDRGKAMGFWGLGIVVAPMLGPVLGGWLTDQYTWRWVFYINVPIGVLALVMTTLFIFDPPYIRRTSESIDYWGIGMLAVGIGTLQVLLDKGQENDWFGSHLIVAMAVISTLAIIGFIIYELVVAHPVVDLRVFKNTTYATGAFLMAILGVGLYGSTVLVPLVLQLLFGYTALQAGIVMMPRGLGSFFAMPFVGAIMTKFDGRKLLAIGMVTCGVVLYMVSNLSLSASGWNYGLPLLAMGFALGFLFVPLTTITMDPIPNEGMGNATSLFNLVRNVGGSIGIAAVTTMQIRAAQVYTNVLGRNVSVYKPGTQLALGQIRRTLAARGSDPFPAPHRADALLFGMVQQQAGMLAYNDVFRVLAALFFLMLPFIFLMRKPKASHGVSIH